ncbi:hypothetical protein C5167_017550, partial [Papaver somniferum]
MAFSYESGRSSQKVMDMTSHSGSGGGIMDKPVMVMVICWLLGNGCLLAWNSMLTMQDYYEYLFLVNSKKGKPLKGSCAAPANGGPLEVKHKKTKLTNPNPFRLSTDMNQVQSELRLARNLIAEKDLEVQRIYTTNSQYIKENERLRAIMGVW